MNEPISLDYAKRRPFSGAALAAFTIGMCSGPIAFSIIWLGRESIGYGIEIVGDFVAFACGVISFAFSAFVYIRLQRPDGPRGRNLALAGTIVTVIWVIALCCFFEYVSEHLE
jgi:hypothetical protein